MDICKTKCNSLFPVPNSIVYRIPLPMFYPYYVKVHDCLSSLVFYQSVLFCWSHPWKTVYFWSITVLSWRGASRMWLLRSWADGLCFSRFLHYCCPHVLCIWCFCWGYEGTHSLGNGRQPHVFLSRVKRVHSTVYGLGACAAWSPIRAPVCDSAH